MASRSFSRLIRFVPTSDPSSILIGEPVDEALDVGAALYAKKTVEASVFSGKSVLEPGSVTGEKVNVDKVLSPLTRDEVKTIRCIGLNYKQHAAEVNMDLPTVPVLFMKPDTALADPWPATITLPKITQGDDSGDYESELAVVLGKEAKNVSEADAPDYILGYTAANDVSSRASQFAQSQWCFSKGFDESCPLGPVLVSTKLITDPNKLHVRGLKNDKVVQDCGIDDLIFSVAKLVSFLSQGTTLPAGTVILTGTPAGVGVSRKPQEKIRDGDVFTVEILPHIGSLISVFKNE